MRSFASSAAPDAVRAPKDAAASAAAAPQRVKIDVAR